MNKIVIDKTVLKDSKGRFLTQSLFLELGYKDSAVFTLKDDHYTYNGKLYPSLKRLFIEEGDPTGYLFSKKHLLGWDHWTKMRENLTLFKHIKKWEEELELKLRADSLRDIIISAKGGNYQAARYLLNGEWKPSKKGRMTKKETEREKRIQAGIDKAAEEADYLKLVGA